jgi:hypothetical protein
MADANAKSGSESTSEQPKAAALTRKDESTKKPEEKVKSAVSAAMVGSDSTSEQP